MAIHRKRVTSSEFDCIYDGNRIKEMAIRSLLEEEAVSLFADSANLGSGPVGVLQRVTHDGESYFARCYTSLPFHRAGFFRALVWKRFIMLETLVEAGVPTPAPLFAAKMKAGPFCQIYVGDYCAESTTLKQAMTKGAPQMRSPSRKPMPKQSFRSTAAAFRVAGSAARTFSFRPKRHVSGSPARGISTGLGCVHSERFTTSSHTAVRASTTCLRQTNATCYLASFLIGP